MLTTLCVIVALIGVLLIVLGAIPPTAAYVPRGVPAGIALLVIGVVLYVILRVTGVA